MTLRDDSCSTSYLRLCRNAKYIRFGYPKCRIFLHQSVWHSRNFEFVVDQLTFGNGSTVMNSDSEMSGASFEMYPNPANDFITILSNFSDAQISIFDINGRMLKSQSMTGLQKENQLPVNLNRGIYYVRMVSGGERYTKKLIIK